MHLEGEANYGIASRHIVLAKKKLRKESNCIWKEQTDIYRPYFIIWDIKWIRERLSWSICKAKKKMVDILTKVGLDIILTWSKTIDKNSYIQIF